jgi:Predicted nucleotide-binding protein containing TIR-like domain
MEITVFYAWQSDISVPSKVNRNFIEDALKEAVKRIKRDEAVRIEPVIDRDTKGVSGTPHIPQTILDKIKACNAFVADITIINRNSKFRLCPNPNVLFELGYAVNQLGWNRVILVMNEAFGAIKELPFDLEKRRVSNYYLTSSSVDKAEQKKRLVDQIELALRRILDEVESELDLKRIGIPDTTVTSEKEKVGPRLAKEHDFVSHRKTWLISELGVKEVKANSTLLVNLIEEEISFQFESTHGMDIKFENRSKDDALDIVFKYGFKVIYEIKWRQAYSNAVEQCGLRVFKNLNKCGSPSTREALFTADLNENDEITWLETGRSDGRLKINELAEKFVLDFMSDIRSVIRAEHESGSGLKF